MVQGVLGRRRFLVSFQNGCEKNLSLNKLTVVTAHKILVEEATEVSTIPELPEDNFKNRRGNIDLSMLYYSLKRRTKLTVRRSRRN